MNNQKIKIRIALPNEYEALGKIMVQVYSQLSSFPSPQDQPKYYAKLANIGNFTSLPHTKLLIAVNDNNEIKGGVVYFGDMTYYGSGGTATKEKNAAGFKLLAVDPSSRGEGIGKLLTNACIDLAKKENQNQLIIHSTKAMQIAWKMYEKLGFKRYKDLDFTQENLSVYGFRLKLK